jgi:transposase
MTMVPTGVKVLLALGYNDMRKGMDGRATLAQETLKKDPFSGHLCAFRGKKADPVLGWKRAVPVQQAARSRRLRWPRMSPAVRSPLRRRSSRC